MKSVAEYYQNGDVRRRILEYCGTPDGSPDDITAVYLVGFGPAMAYRGQPFESAPPGVGFDWFLGEGLDFFRSNWDEEHLLAVFDFEYVNHDQADLVYREPDYAFGLLEPIIEEARDWFADYGLEPMVVMTGQGYHFTFQVKKGTDAYEGLADIGEVLPSLAGKYDMQEPSLSPREGEAFNGLGRLLELMAGDFIERVGDNCPVPLTIGDPVPGPSDRGREQVNLDLSMFADPIFMRDVRAPFSSHQKHRVYRHKMADWVVEEIPPQYAIPKTDMDLDELLAMRRDPEAVEEYAGTVTTEIPAQESAVEAMLDDYHDSDVADAHRRFDEGYQDPHDVWSESYDQLKPEDLPPCIAENIRVPNPRLLEPTHIQSLTRWLCERGWHPKDVAGLIRSKFERDYGWSEDWSHYDAATRANVWVRFYYTMMETGRDHLTDMNCVSFQERDICVEPFCGWNVGERVENR